MMGGRAHFHAQGFELVGAGDDAAVVIRKNTHRPAVQLGVEHALAAHVEVVAVH